MNVQARRAFIIGSFAVLSVGCAMGNRKMAAERQEAPHANRPRQISAEALRVHHSAIVFDGHNDLPWQMRRKADSSFDTIDIARPVEQLHTDIPRLRLGGVGAQFWSAYVPADTMKTGGACRYALEQIDLIHRMADRYPDAFEMAYTADDIERIHSEGKIASLIGIEGGHAIEDSLGALRMFYQLGTRYMTLTHSDTLAWCDSATDDAEHGGLTDFGEQVVLEMNRLGMLVDISHVSADAMRDVLRVSKAPVIASHSSAYALAPHVRNVPDDVLRLVAENGGVIMVNFYSGFVHPDAARASSARREAIRRIRESHEDETAAAAAVDEWRRAHPVPAGDVETVVDHIDHIAKIAGVDHVGLGSDYDGVDRLPAGLEDVSCFPNITQELLNRGYAGQQVRKILGGNALRALRQAERVARQLKASR